jgi:drug/metabolite transporter (DMT)-like permease
MLTLILCFRVLLGPFTNVFQKQLSNKGANSVFVVFITYLLFGLFLLPFTFFIEYQSLGKEFWQNIIIASVIDGVGNIFLVKALRSTELSIFGPINSFKPAIAMLISFVLIREVPTIKGLIGLVVIMVGSVLITYKKEKKIQISRGLVYRITGIFFSALGAVFVKQAITYSSPEVSMVFWTLIALPIMFLVLLFDIGKMKSDVVVLKSNLKDYLLLMLFYSLMQYITLLCFNLTLVGYSLAIFQLSSIVSVMLGYRYFNEKGIRRKIFYSVIMIIGAVLILLR